MVGEGHDEPADRDRRRRHQHRRRAHGRVDRRQPRSRRRRRPTSPRGIITALRAHLWRVVGTATAEIAGVMIGTTHFTNAVVERKRLEPTARGATRTAGDAGAAADGRLAGRPARGARPPHLPLPRRPRVRRPRDLAARSGRDPRGGRTRSRARGIRAIAVSSVFSPVNTEMEQRGGRASCRGRCPGAHVTLSSEIGRIGLLERENAAILNACLRELARATIVARSSGRSPSSGSTRRSTSPRTTAR